MDEWSLATLHLALSPQATPITMVYRLYGVVSSATRPNSTAMPQILREEQLHDTDALANNISVIYQNLRRGWSLATAQDTFVAATWFQREIKRTPTATLSCLCHIHLHRPPTNKWLNNTTLREQFPNLFNVVRNKTSLVAEVMSRTNLNLSIRRPIVGIKLVELQNLVHLLAPVTLNLLRDTFVWGAHRDETFSTQSMYYILINNPNFNSNCVLWNLKLPSDKNLSLVSR
jgi:hypothetical protein